MIVSNATPLLAFARIDALELLAHIVQHMLIPETVWHEVTRDPWRPGAEAIRRAKTWQHLGTLLPPFIDRHQRPRRLRYLLAQALWL